MPDITFSCQKCQQSLEAPPDMAGEAVDCPACWTSNIIPVEEVPISPKRSEKRDKRCNRLSIYVVVEGKKSGPFTVDKIRHKMSDGKLCPSDLAWHEGLNDWVKLETLLQNVPIVDEPPALPENLENIDLGINFTIQTSAGTTHNVKVPPRGPYEPEASKKQKNLLSKHGIPPERLRRLVQRQLYYAT